MNNPLKTPKVQSVMLLLAHVPIGVYFLIAGYVKVTKIGVAAFAAQMQPTADKFLGPQLGSPFLHALPFVEMLVGVTLIVGLYTRVSATIATLLLISISIAVTHVEFNASGTGPPLNPNIVFLGLTLLLMSVGGGEIAVDHSFKSIPGPAKK